MSKDLGEPSRSVCYDSLVLWWRRIRGESDSDNDDNMTSTTVLVGDVRGFDSQRLLQELLQAGLIRFNFLWWPYRQRCRVGKDLGHFDLWDSFGRSLGPALASSSSRPLLVLSWLLASMMRCDVSYRELRWCRATMSRWYLPSHLLYASKSSAVTSAVEPKSRNTTLSWPLNKDLSTISCQRFTLSSPPISHSTRPRRPCLPSD